MASQKAHAIADAVFTARQLLSHREFLPPPVTQMVEKIETMARELRIEFWADYEILLQESSAALGEKP